MAWSIRGSSTHERVWNGERPVKFRFNLVVGGALFAFLKRRASAQRVLAAAAPAAVVTDASAEELAELERALKESEQ